MRLNEIGRRLLGFLIVFLLVLSLAAALGCDSEPGASGVSQEQQSQENPAAVPTKIAYVRNNNIWISAEDRSWEYQLTDRPFLESEPDTWNTLGGLSFSPDGTRLAYWKDVDTSYDIEIADIDAMSFSSLTSLCSADLQKLAASFREFNLCWSKDGNSIYCTIVRDDPDIQKPVLDVACIDLRTSSIAIVVHGGDSPSLSSDGKTLSYLAGLTVYEMNLETREEREIGGGIRESVYSSSGRARASISHWEPDIDIDAYDPDTDSRFRYVTGTTPIIQHPSFSPNNKRVIFSITGPIYGGENGEMISVSSTVYVGILRSPSEIDGDFPEPDSIQKWGPGLYPAWSPR